MNRPRFLTEIATNPLSFPGHRALAKRLAVRRALLSRFPYEVVFQLHDDTITVIAVAHSSRVPGYWADRLRDP